LGLEFTILIMKVVFVNPRYQEWVKSLPLGIAYLAAVLRQEGYFVEVIDANAEELNTPEVMVRIKTGNFEMVCVTAVTAQITHAWQILKAVKAYNSRIVTVLGGVHPTALTQESLSQDCVDFIVRGEGEITLMELIHAIENNRQFKDISGLSYKIENIFQHNPDRALINDLDSFPFPARDLFPFPGKYSSPYKLRRYHATLITSRGCPGTCIFCNKNISGFAFRMRSPENVVEEIGYLKSRFRVEEFHMADDCFSWDQDRVRRICELLLENRLNVSWACSNGIRIDSVDGGLLRLMRKAGCYRVSFGVEAGSEQVLKKIGKKIRLNDVRHAFEMAQSAGLVTVALFMLGNFGENKKTMEETIRFSKGLTTDYAQFTIATPFPGTPFYRIVERQGRFLSRDWAQYGVFSQPLFELDGLSAELMLKMYKRAYREFYFRPRQILFILYKRFRYLNIVDVFRLFNSFVETLRRMIK